jgi:hypothetical protein
MIHFKALRVSDRWTPKLFGFVVVRCGLTSVIHRLTSSTPLVG